jgi:Ca2+-transporting ATPase
MRTLSAIFELFPAARRDGLADAQVGDSRAKFGSNRLTPLPRESAWKKFLAKFDDAIIKILLAASLLKIVVDLFETSPLAGGIALVVMAVALAVLFLLKLTDWVPTALFALAVALFGTSVALGHPSYDGLAVMIAVVLATGVSFLSEYRSDREFEKLNAQKDAVRVKVVRGGGVVALPLDEVVVGDLIVLEAGDEIPADGRVVLAGELQIDQSLMTGESEPVRKAVQSDADAADGPDKPGCVYRGTQVVDGLGQMTVTNVGDDTMIGQIARRLTGGDDQSDAADERVQQKLTISKALTPLQLKLEKLAKVISRVGYLAAGLIFLALLARGLYVGEMNPATVHLVDGVAEPQGWLGVVHHLLDYFVYMVIVIVVAVPEGLPMSVTVSLALAMRKMTRANALVRQLVATETIGSATVICTDKTGTLTMNQMRVARLWAGGQTAERGAAAFTPTRAKGVREGIATPTDWVAVNSALNSTGSLETKGERRVVLGNSTEGALLLWLADGGTEYAHERLHHPVLYRTAFSSEHKRMTSVAELLGRPTVLMKGAPEVVLERCTHITTADGVRAITDADRTAISADLSAAAGDAMRTLAFAHKPLPADFPREVEAITDRRSECEEGLTFDGFVAIRDPIRPEVPEAIARCRSAGIEVKMITGDNAETARAIARDIGLLDSPNAVVLTSAELADLSDDELKAKLPALRVVARAKPLDKYRLVRLLQEQGHVVAMTGDGTNDAPSLKKADVGLAMGVTGTEVAKEASKIVLLDDAFSTIVKAVHWGRALYENIQRFIAFQLTINLSALLIAFLGPFLGLKPPFTVLQLLWINVIMDTFAAIALCSEPPRAGLMKVPPKRRDESIVTRTMLGTIVATGLFFVVVMTALLLGMEYAGWFAEGSGPNPPDWEFAPLNVRQVTLFFTVYVFFQVWNQINCRSLTPDVSGFRGLHKNPLFLLIASLTVVGQVVIVCFGGGIFDVEPLGWLDWAVIVGGTAAVLVYAEAVRLVRRVTGRR